MSRALAVLLFLAAPLFAQTDVILQHLRADYEKHALLIRGFYQDSLLQYDVAGNLLHRGDTGSWTTSFLCIKSVAFHDGRLELQGSRCVQLFDDHKRKFQLHRTDLKVLLTVQADPAADEDALRKSLAAVFVAPSEPLTGILPEPWHWVAEHMDGEGVLAKPPAKVAPTGEPCPPQPSLDKPCGVRDAVKAPKPIHTPDPDFNDFARALHVRGTSVLEVIIDETGRAQKLHLTKPLGCGLDESALDRVSGWTFHPATRDGVPVPVKITVEVNFSWQ